MDSKRIKLVKKTGVPERRQCTSWIESFVKFTDSLGTPAIFRRWTAIGAIGAVLEQRVWMETFTKLYPNFFIALIGHPGVGKSTSITQVRRFLNELTEPDKVWIAPTQMSRASLIDALVASKKFHHRPKGEVPSEYNSMICLADEWGALISDFQTDFISTMTTLYDVTVPYTEWKRTTEIKLHIESPQLSIIAGSTPSVLLRFMPEHAWDQGFTSRIILVYSDEQPVLDTHFPVGGEKELPLEMVNDLRKIYRLGRDGHNQFTVDPEFIRLADEWRRDRDGEPKPSHPRLLHYNKRRWAHVYKLAMVSSVDRDDSLRITDRDFYNALGYLTEAEANMPELFTAGATSTDTHAMDDIRDFLRRQGRPLRWGQVAYYASRFVASDRIGKVLNAMIVTGRLKEVGRHPVTAEAILIAGNPEAED